MSDPATQSERASDGFGQWPRGAYRQDGIGVRRCDQSELAPMCRHPRLSLVALAALLGQFPPAMARPQPLQASSGQDSGLSASARNARAATGEVGQRQSREEIQGVTPLARIENRLDTRVNSRLRTRLDRNYSGLQSGANDIEDANQRARPTAPAR